MRISLRVAAAAVAVLAALKAGVHVLTEKPMCLSTYEADDIIDAAKTVRDDIFYLCHGGPINTPEDAAFINEHTDTDGFVGASSLAAGHKTLIPELIQLLKKEVTDLPLEFNNFRD